MACLIRLLMTVFEISLCNKLQPLFLALLFKILYEYGVRMVLPDEHD